MLPLNDEEVSILTTSEKFRSTVRATTTAEKSYDDDSENDLNMEVLDALTNIFPSLTITCSYNLSIDNTNVDRTHDDGERDNIEGQEDSCESIPGTWRKKDNINLIQLSLIFLTEYTRSMTSGVFLRSSQKSVQAVIVIAFALRDLICRTLEDPLRSIERYILGNVYFCELEIPSDLLEFSTILAFTDDKSNRNRLESKLKITAKEYRAMKLVQTGQSEEQPESEDDFEMEGSDIFHLPSCRALTQ